jgi:hypothetical protein
VQKLTSHIVTFTGLEDYAAVVEHFQLFTPFVQFVPNPDSTAQSVPLDNMLGQITPKDYLLKRNVASVRSALRFHTHSFTPMPSSTR